MLVQVFLFLFQILWRVHVRKFHCILGKFGFIFGFFGWLGSMLLLFSYLHPFAFLLAYRHDGDKIFPMTRFRKRQLMGCGISTHGNFHRRGYSTMCQVLVGPKLFAFIVD